MRVLRVVVVRTGGFAGIVREAEVDDPDEAERLADAVRAEGPRKQDASRDGFAYAFTVVTTAAERTYDLAEAAMGPELRTAVHALFAR